MIQKPFNLNLSKNYNYFFLYGENDGLKEELINIHFKSKFNENIYKNTENEIFKNIDAFYNHIFSKSFFENEKLIIITDVSDKICETVSEIIEKKPTDIKIILVGGLFQKKSKLRKLFEKEKDLICIPCYKDNLLTTSNLIKSFFSKKKIVISQEIVNLLIEQTRGDRKSLKNELDKIDIFLDKKAKINILDIKKLVKANGNYDLGELVDSCLSGYKKKTLSILNENILNQEDIIKILRIFLQKLKRIKNLIIQNENNNNLETTINNYKPPIFWMDKDNLKKQLKMYSLRDINRIIKNNKKNKGLISFEYQDLDQLNKILDVIKSNY